jgi:hypothetical protein
MARWRETANFPYAGAAAGHAAHPETDIGRLLAPNRTAPNPFGAGRYSAPSETGVLHRGHSAARNARSSWTRGVLELALLTAALPGGDDGI